MMICAYEIIDAHSLSTVIWLFVSSMLDQFS